MEKFTEKPEMTTHEDTRPRRWPRKAEETPCVRTLNETPRPHSKAA